MRKEEEEEEIEVKILKWRYSLVDSYLNMMLLISNKEEINVLRIRIRRNENLTKDQKKKLYKILKNKEKSLDDDFYCIIL